MRPAGDTIEPITKGRLKAGLAVLIGATAIASCGPTEAVVLAGVGLANFVYTDKLPSDYLAEFASGAECNTLKALKDKGPWCRESFERVVYERPLYCYKTLGQITCYDKKDPYGRNSTRVR
jgi:hypothetical protein